jgi:hypothetical protein
MIFHGKGGYDFETIYNMPIWLRNYTFSEIKKFYEEQKKSSEPATKKGTTTLVTPDGKVNKEAFKEASTPYKGKVGYK